MSIKVMLDPRGQRCIDIRQYRRIDGGLAGFISWERLSQELRRSGEIKEGETLEALVLSDDGIQYHVQRKGV